MPQEWRDAHISTCHNRGRIGTGVVTTGISHMAGGGKALLIIVAKGEGLRGRAVRIPAQTFGHPRYVCSTSTARVGTGEQYLTEYVPHWPAQCVRPCPPHARMKNTSLFRSPPRMIKGHLLFHGSMRARIQLDDELDDGGISKRFLIRQGPW